MWIWNQCDHCVYEVWQCCNKQSTHFIVAYNKIHKVHIYIYNSIWIKERIFKFNVIVNMTEGSRNVLYLSVLYFFTNPFLLHIWKTWKISSERKVKKRTWDIQVSVFWRSSRGRLESTSQECPLNVRLGRLPDVRLRHPQDGQIGSLRDVLGML